MEIAMDCHHVKNTRAAEWMDG
jgi:hypothetical protein